MEKEIKKSIKQFDKFEKDWNKGVKKGKGI